MPVTNLAVNVYGVPWIIGAKKGFPNFNEFAMETSCKSRANCRLLKNRTAADRLLIHTNQMYIFSISNSIGVELLEFLQQLVSQSGANCGSMTISQ